MKIIVLGLVALLLGAGTAQADFKKEWIFKCNYTGIAGKVTTGCRVLANVCEFTVDDKIELMTPPRIEPCLNFMIVNCGGEEIYKGPAEHKVKEIELPFDHTASFQIIKGIASEENHHPPMFRYGTQDPEQEDPFYITSWLKLGSDELKGFCEVHHPRD